MTLFPAEEKERTKKERTREAIALAIKSRWREAETVNRLIIEDFPNDVDAYNRLGKALTELGHYSEARKTFQRSLELSPYNTIAKKNLLRLANLQDEPPHISKARSKETSQLFFNFVAESTKAGIVPLVNPAPRFVLAKVASGDTAHLYIKGKKLAIKDPNDEYLGEIEPRLALRLTRLINGGNRYEATVTSVGDGTIAVMIREVYKHPSQTSIVSFPARWKDASKAYPESTLLRYDMDFSDEVKHEEGAGETNEIEKEVPPLRWPGSDSEMDDDDEEDEPSILEASGFHEETRQDIELEDDLENET